MINEDYVICPICGSHKRNMTKHMSMAHDLSKDQWMTMYPDIPAVCKSTSKLISTSLENNWSTDADYRERCSSYWNSDLHAKRKSRDMSLMWESGKVSGKLISEGIMNSPSSRLSRSVRMKRISDLCWSDPEYVKKRRLAGRIQMLKNMKDPEYNKSNKILYQGTYYRSLLEVDYAKLFVSNNIEFIYEDYYFTYLLNDIEHIYVPDFYIPSKDIFLEVKYKYQIDDLAILKAESVIKSGKLIRFIDEDLVKSPDNLIEYLNS